MADQRKIFCLDLQKGFCKYEYMGIWERFNETSLMHKKEFYSNRTIDKITNADYNHAKKF